MPKTTVKETRKKIRAMLDKHMAPPEMNPIDSLIEMSKKSMTDMPMKKMGY